MEATFKETGENEFKLTMTGLTLGKIAAIRSALERYNSPVGNDVLNAIEKGIAKRLPGVFTKTKP